MSSPWRPSDQDLVARQMAKEAQDTVAAQAAALTPSVGSAPVPALQPGGTVKIVVRFSPEITGGYQCIPVLVGAAGILTLGGVTAKTSSTVTVTVKAPLTAVAAGATVEVTCFRTS